MIFRRRERRAAPERLTRLAGRVERQHARLADVEREVRRLAPQLAALESRLADLHEKLDRTPLRASAADAAESSSLLEEVRRVHGQVRARISAAVVYEERLRVLEERLRVDSATGRPLPED